MMPPHEPLIIPIELDRAKLRRFHTLLGQIALAIDSYLNEEEPQSDGEKQS